MHGLKVLVCLLTVFGSAVSAAPETSLRPLARSEPVLTADNREPGLRPQARSSVGEAALTNLLVRQFQRENDPDYEGDPTDIEPARQRAFAALSPRATGLSIRPNARPDAIVEKAMAQRRQRARGAVCGDPDIQGEAVGFVAGRISGCGVESAVRVRSILGVGLSQSAMVDCKTAAALKTWIQNGMKPAVGSVGGGVTQIKVAGHYACRPRNNQSGAKISEHGRGRAIDISGFHLRDGTEISLLRDWARHETGPILRKMHKRACGIFGTVLGPESNRFHKDHFHFDTARYRSGSFCR